MADPPPTATKASHGPVDRRVVDRLLEARVGRLDVRAVEDLRLDAERRHLVGDALRVAGRRDAGVGHHQHPADAVRREVVADLVGGAGAELELRGAVGEDALGVRGQVHQSGTFISVRAWRAADSRSRPRASSRSTHAAWSVEPSTSTTRGAASRDSGRQRRPEDQVDAVVVLDQPVGPGTGEVRAVHVGERAGHDVQPGLLVDLADQRLARVLAVVDAPAGQRPPAGDAGAPRHPGEQHLVVAHQQGVGGDPLAPRRCVVAGHGPESRDAPRGTPTRPTRTGGRPPVHEADSPVSRSPALGTIEETDAAHP